MHFCCLSVVALGEVSSHSIHCARRPCVVQLRADEGAGCFYNCFPPRGRASPEGQELWSWWSWFLGTSAGPGDTD